MQVMPKASSDSCLARRVIAYAIIVVIALTAISGVSSANSDNSSVQSSRLYFPMDDSFFGLSLNFAADLSWNDALRVTQGNTVQIGYAFSPGPASLSVFLPLGDYLWMFGVKDARFDIQLGDTPLEERSFSLTSLLGVPKLIASVNLVIEPSLAMCEVCCSQGQDRLQMDASTLTWRDWSDKDIAFCSDESGQAIVSASFSYTLTLRITLTMLASLLEYDLIPHVSLLSLSGSHAAVTNIDVEIPVPSWLEKNGLAAVSFVVEGFLLLLVLATANRVFEEYP